MTEGIDPLTTFKRFVDENPYTGTTEQIVTLSLGIIELSKLDRSTYSVFKDESGINEKIFSKLRVIGKTFKELTSKQRQEVIEGLPPSYSVIHILCSLKPEEILTSVRTKNITPSTTVEGSRRYTKQIRFPHLTTNDTEKGRWSSKTENLWSVLRPEDLPIGDDILQNLEMELRRVCKEYGVHLQKTSTQGTISLRNEDWKRYSNFWRQSLEKELTYKWFNVCSDFTKKKFNIKNVDELRDTPLRQFTGFLIHVDGGREEFWKLHGQSYVSKVCYLMGNTEDGGTRYNLKRRLEQVLGERKELSIWYNLMLKNSGLIQPI